MIQEPQSPKSQTSNAVTSNHLRRNGWLVVVALIVLPSLIAGGFWWQSLRPESCYRRGRAALLAVDRLAVMRESKRLLKTPGFERHGRLLAGLLLVIEGKPEKALPELAEAARSEAIAVDAMTAAAKCYYLLGRFRDAVGTGLAALSKDPEAIDARRWLAAAFYDLGDTGNAAFELETISAKAPDDYRSERLLGLIAKDHESFERAIGHYREALRRNPPSTELNSILQELGESLVKTSRFEEALSTLQDCDRSALVLTLKAECELNLGHFPESQKRLQEALQLDPHYVPAKVKRGALLLSLGRFEEAVDELEEAVRLEPYSSQPHFQLAKAYGRQGKQAEAKKELESMQQIQDIEREFSQLHETAAEKPNDADIRYRIGLLATKLQKVELAQLWFRAALAVDPQHLPARTALAKSDPMRTRP